MKKNTKFLLVGIATALTGYVIFKLMKKKPKTFGEAVKDAKDTIINVPKDIVSSATKYTSEAFPLKLWSGGNRVKTLQNHLNRVANSNLVVDGKFGMKTENALISKYGKKEVTQGMWESVITK